jgi:hypothetical protein
MVEKFSRSWQLIKASASVLRQDKELLVFPLVSSLAALLVTAAFIAPIFGLAAADGLDRLDQFNQDDPLLNAAVIAYAFVFYLCQYFVVFFFNTALVGAAMIRLEGGDPTVADGLRIAGARIGRILGYAAIAATVGILLRIVQQRAGAIGKWIVGFIGAAWNVATFMVVPILVTREVGPIDAVKESVVLLKRTWGENVIGQGGIGIVFGLLWVLLILAGAAVMVGAVATGSAGVIGVAAGLLLIALVLLALVQAALSGIYSAALYRHASGAGATPGFDGALLSQAFAPKR